MNTADQTTRLQRWLLFLFTATTPLQENIPTVFGMSFPVIIIALLTIILLFQNNRGAFFRALGMPLVLSFLLYVAVTLYVEYMHPTPLYGGIVKTLLNYGGAIVLGITIKDERAFKYTVGGYLFSGIYLGIALYIYGWGMLSSGATTFFEADNIRDEILTNLPIREGANTIASRSAICIVLVLLLLLLRTNFYKVGKRLLIVIMIVQAISLFVTMSRTGLVILAGTFLILAYLYRLFSYTRIGYTFLVTVVLYILAPEAYIERMQIGASRNDYDQLDSRSRTLDLSLTEIRKNYIWGTGEGNLWQGDYSKKSALSFYNVDEDYYFVGGTHNLYFQTVLQWGLLGLAAFLFMQYRIFRALPRRNKNDFVSLAVATFNIGIFILLFFVHEGGNKEFAIAYGLLIAYHMNLKGKTTNQIGE